MEEVLGVFMVLMHYLVGLIEIFLSIVLFSAIFVGVLAYNFALKHTPPLAYDAFKYY